MASDRVYGREIRCPECDQPVQIPTKEQIEEVQRAAREAQAAARKLAANKPIVPVEIVPEVARGPAEARHSEPALEDPAPVRFLRAKPSSADDMDMTPMVDVTFLLLIFFMITASFSVQKSIQRPAQKKDTPSTNAVVQPDQDNSDTVTVQVDEFNAYNILMADKEETASSKQDLIRLLVTAHEGEGASAKPTKLVVQAHEDCLHVSVINALDAGREAQFESFEVTTVEQFD